MADRNFIYRPGYRRELSKDEIHEKLCKINTAINKHYSENKHNGLCERCRGTGSETFDMDNYGQIETYQCTLCHGEGKPDWVTKMKLGIK